MPKETFWDSATAIENDGLSEPVLTVTWHEDDDGVYLNGVKFDYSGIERLAKTLRRATGKDRTVGVTLVANADEYTRAMADAKRSVRELNAELQKASDLSATVFRGRKSRVKGEVEFVSTSGAIVWRKEGGPLTVGNYLSIDAEAEHALREYFQSDE